MNFLPFAYRKRIIVLVLLNHNNFMSIENRAGYCTRGNVHADVLNLPIHRAGQRLKNNNIYFNNND